MAIAEGQHGVFTYAQARAAGYDRKQIMARVQGGVWVQVQPRTFRVRGAPTGWRVSIREALADNPHLMASRQTAAALHGLERVATYDAIHVTRPGTGRPRRRGDVIVHTARGLVAQDVKIVDGLRCSSGERTIIDLATGRVANVDVLAMLDDAVGRRIADRQLHPLARSRACLRARPGRRHDRTSDSAWRGSGLPLLAGADFRVGLRGGGLPPARFNHEIRVAGRRTAFADAWWPPDIVVELNGLRFHDLVDSRRNDSRRNNDLTVAGYRVLVFTYLDIITRPTTSWRRSVGRSRPPPERYPSQPGPRGPARSLGGASQQYP